MVWKTWIGYVQVGSVYTGHFWAVCIGQIWATLYSVIQKPTISLIGIFHIFWFWNIFFIGNLHFTLKKCGKGFHRIFSVCEISFYKGISFPTQKICDYQPKTRTAYNAILIRPITYFLWKKQELPLSVTMMCKGIKHLIKIQILT